MTSRESAILTAYTGILCGPMPAFHAYAEEIMGRPILTHEFASKEVWNALKEKSHGDFLTICPRDGMSEEWK